ncbi:MAG: hypothetical protein N0C84_03225 [Candidatus Thiodiazotropha taylori]|uniref:Uncharacterized protein n=1 Tax=Candidatus Thiodiazotropha taylori TaxID=2792791 RepID=A0A9E4N261_9GAMM|nr:hypothetical protein [Candidatus Thiodiazotropha taylori]MCG7945336.1 hypothetical protein [Candidatus Thiodiazotropha taylori]MCW4255450.1 hypothetical protein [Candidatus Thiodiazotropha taylori]MCW4255460.1 hypothetical protein [Candidatus Thiodiazotropha taylori]
MSSRFNEIRKQIDSRSIRANARALPWPYNGMVNDVLGAIQTGGNYLAAMGLSSYTEMCGRQIFYDGDNNKEDWECFNKYLKYMGADEVLNKSIRFEGNKTHVKDAVRNGLVHRYFMKIENGMVVLNSNNEEALQTGFIVTGDDSITLAVIPYFKLFYKSLINANEAGILKWAE